MDIQLFQYIVSRQKIVTFEETLSNTQILNPRFVDKIQNSYIEKACKKICLIIEAKNDKNKNLVLMQLPKMQWISQHIGTCFTAIF